MRDKCHLIVNYFVKAIADDNVEPQELSSNSRDPVYSALANQTWRVGRAGWPILARFLRG
jgi:hypothetical protein